MKKRLLMLLSIFMTITSVGWMQAQETTGTISAELEKAQTGQEVVFGIITKQGNVPANTMVRVALKAKDNAFDGWKSYFYEPSKSEWIEWNSENDGFGSAEGFAFQDATSYIKVIPQTAGTYEYTLTVTKVDGNTVLLEKTQTLVVTDAAVSPMAKIGETYYASLPTAVHFAGKDADIKLTAGEFNLSEQLVIDKPLSLTGVVQDDGKPTTIIQAKADAIWPEYNSKKNLISIQGKATGVVTLNGIYVSFSKASGINAQSTMETKLIDVALTENTNAGLLVHSKVEATRLLTFKNGWGGVNVDGTLSSSPLFKFDADSFFGEQSKIWSEDTTTDPNTLVGIPIGWISYVGVQGTSSKEMRYWTNSKIFEVSKAVELKNAISAVPEGGTIILERAATFGTAETIQSFGAINKKNITIKAADGEGVKPKVYGTIQLMADGCVVEGLEFHTKGGSHPLKNAIDVVAMSVSIRNNDFIMTTPANGSVGNGITIWPYGDATTPSFVVSGNTFKDFTGLAQTWNSTAFQIADACSLNEHFGQPYTTEKSNTVVIANEKNYWTDNK